MNLKNDLPLGQLVASIEDHVPDMMREAQVPGLSIALVQNSELAWAGGFGVRNVESGDPVTPETVFEGCSLSKPVFAWSSPETLRNR